MTRDKSEWEKFVEENLAVSRLAHIIQKRSDGPTTREYAIALAKELIATSAKAKAVEASERAAVRKAVRTVARKAGVPERRRFERFAW